MTRPPENSIETKPMTRNPYICPKTRQQLFADKSGLRRADGALFPYLPLPGAGPRVANFLEVQESGGPSKEPLQMYEADDSAEVYRNFLDWLFATFAEDEEAVRRSLVAKLRLQAGGRVLITGCGLGEDLPLFFDQIGRDGEVYAQDISARMVSMASHNVRTHPDAKRFGKTSFSVGDATELPFADSFFDAAFHFGGINLFGSVRDAINEMNRVVKPGGKVVFGDEGVAPWLQETDYGKAAICNNALWGHETPLSELPENCTDVNVTWVLGNCFWLIDFVVSETGPYMNMDVPHKGRRGGSMRTRYFGQLEGVDPETKKAALEAAAASGTSIHEWLDNAIRKAAEGK